MNNGLAPRSKLKPDGSGGAASENNAPFVRNLNPFLALQKGQLSQIVVFVFAPEILALKHESRILVQWSNHAYGSRKSQASSPWAKQHRFYNMFHHGETTYRVG